MHVVERIANCKYVGGSLHLLFAFVLIYSLCPRVHYTTLCMFARECIYSGIVQTDPILYFILKCIYMSANIKLAFFSIQHICVTEQHWDGHMLYVYFNIIILLLFYVSVVMKPPIFFFVMLQIAGFIITPINLSFTCLQFLSTGHLH